MSGKKDQKRPDLIIPYVKSSKESKDPDIGSTLASTLPMVAIITRNKMLGWTAVLFALQAWLVESPVQRANASTPSILAVFMSLASLMTSYVTLFLPPTPGSGGTGTNPPAPVPPPA